MAELKPCPFCGEKKHLEIRITEAWTDIYYILCVMCRAHGPLRDDEKSAIDAWNKRSK